MKKPTIDQMHMELHAKGGKVKEPKNTVKAYKLFRVHEKSMLIIELIAASFTKQRAVQWTHLH